MIPRIKTFEALDDFFLKIEFDDGKKILYDLKEDIVTIPSFMVLKTETGLYQNYRIDKSRTDVSWSDNVDLPSDILYEYGKIIS